MASGTAASVKLYARGEVFRRVFERAAPIYVAPVAFRQPAKSPEPKHPAVSLLGTVIGTDVQIGVFLEKATNKVVRLRLGEEHQGWVQRLIKAREVTLKDVEETLALSLRSRRRAATAGMPDRVHGAAHATGRFTFS
jgi:hypothetical protein